MSTGENMMSDEAVPKEIECSKKLQSRGRIASAKEMRR